MTSTIPQSASALGAPQLAAETGNWAVLLAAIAGVVLALAFQLLVTNLSVAMGLQIAGPFDEEDHSDDPSGSGGVGRRLRKVTSALGFWALISACIAVFLGAWLGVELAYVDGIAAGIVTGLLVWAVFSFAMLAVESSLLHSIVSTATTSLRSMGQGLGSVFSRSERSRAASMASEVTAAIRDELLGDRRLRSFGQDITRRLDRLEQISDPAHLREELADLVGHTRFHAEVEGAEGDPNRSLVHVTADTGDGHGERMRRVGERARGYASIAKEEYQSDKGATDSTADAAMRIGGVSPEQAEDYRQRFEDYLRRTNADELDPDSLKRDLDTLFEDPRHGWELLKERFSDSGRGTLRGLLTARGVSKKRANQILDWSETALQKVSSSGSSGGGAMTASLSTTGLEQRVRAFLQRVDDPRLRYDDLQAEFELLLEDPRSGSEALLERLRSLDRDTIKSLIASQKNLSEEDAERYVGRVEEARDKVVETGERMKREVTERLEAARQAALEAAEETRRTVATAAWWTFFISIAAAASAALGGWVGAATSIV